MADQPQDEEEGGRLVRQRHRLPQPVDARKALVLRLQAARKARRAAQLAQEE